MNTILPPDPDRPSAQVSTKAGELHNGKVERFHQTMAREWAYGVRYRSHRHRAAALPHWLDHYNTRRPHSSLDGLPPISRVHNLCRQDS
jgi:transposase InsO family protein